MTIYKLVFDRRAKKDWDKLDKAVRNRFSKKLTERLSGPHVPSARLSDFPYCYKIKLSSVGYRLVYQVKDDVLIVLVVAVGRREGDEVYDDTAATLRRLDD